METKVLHIMFTYVYNDLGFQKSGRLYILDDITSVIGWIIMDDL